MTGDGISELLQRAAGDDPGDPPVETLVRRGRRRRRRRRVGVATTAAVVVLAGAVVLSQATQFRIEFAPGEQGDASARVFALPAPGEVSPQWLPDGTPVFVVADEDGAAVVVEALSTHRVALWDKLVGWCTSAEIFQDPHHGAEWGPHGDYFGGPAPTGLATYAARVEGGQVHVGTPQRPTARGEGPPTERAGPSCIWPDVRHTPEEAPWPTITPEQVAEHDGPVVVSGTIINHEDGSARMCSQPSVGPPPRCPPNSAHVTGAEPRLQHSAHTGTYVAVADDGDLHSLVNFGDVDSEYFGPRPRSYSDSDPISVADGVITVPAVDIAYGSPPGDPIPAGVYELRLDNRGDSGHTLVNDDLGIDLVATPKQQAATTVDLPPGEHLFYCRIGGHPTPAWSSSWSSSRTLMGPAERPSRTGRESASPPDDRSLLSAVGPLGDCGLTSRKMPARVRT